MKICIPFRDCLRDENLHPFWKYKINIFILWNSCMGWQFASPVEKIEGMKTCIPLKTMYGMKKKIFKDHKNMESGFQYLLSGQWWPDTKYQLRARWPNNYCFYIPYFLLQLLRAQWHLLGARTSRSPPLKYLNFTDWILWDSCPTKTQLVYWKLFKETKATDLSI